MAPCKEVAGILHGSINTHLPASPTEKQINNTLDWQDMGKCKKGDVVEEDIIARQKRRKCANDVPAGKQTPAAADYSEIPERKLKVAD